MGLELLGEGWNGAGIAASVLGGMGLELLPLTSAGAAESGSDVSAQHSVVRRELQLVIKVSLLGQDLALMLDSCKLVDVPLTPPYGCQSN